MDTKYADDFATIKVIRILMNFPSFTRAEFLKNFVKEAKLRNAVNAQQWLIDNTTSKDRLLLWVDGPWTSGDRELYSVAAMQLWGENRVTLEPTLTDDYGTQKMKDAEPTALVLYGKSMDAVWTFWESIPRMYDPMPPQCYDFNWPIDPTSAFPTPVGHTCIVRLSNAERGRRICAS